MSRSAWTYQTREKWPWLFELARTFLHEAYALSARVTLDQRDAERSICVLLFGRAVSGTEALVTLAASGFLIEADIVFRSNLEALFRLAALVEEPKLLSRYLGEDYPRRRRAMGDLRELLSGIDPRPPGAPSDCDIDNAIREIEQEAKEFQDTHDVAKLREVKTWDWVVAGGQFDFFFGKYLMHSNVVHHAARDLERRIDVREDGQGLKAIYMGIEQESPVEIVLDGLLLLARCIDKFAKAVDEEVSDALREARAELDKRFDVEHAVRGDHADRACT